MMNKILVMCFIAIMLIFGSCSNKGNEKQKYEPQFSFFNEPKDIDFLDSFECYEVFQTYKDKYGLAEGLMYGPELVLLETEGCYDGLEVCSDEDKTIFKAIGTFKYMSNDSVIRTIPIVKLFSTTNNKVVSNGI